MSTLNVSNITDGTTTVGTSYVVNGSAKAWVDGNGTGTVSVDASFNISTMTDNGTGQYTFSFTNAFSSTAYCPQATGRGDATGEGSWNNSARTPAATSCGTGWYDSGGNYQDQTALSWSALGDLA